MSTEALIQRHMDALARADMDAVMADYAEDAVLCSPAGAARGHAQIRAAVEPFATKVLPPGSEFKLLRQVIEGELVYLVWSAESPRFRIPMGTDTFIVRNGKIVAQTVASHIERKG